MATSTYDPRTGTITDAESRWLVDEERLNPEQRDFMLAFAHDPRNVWIKGFAGTGKSILLIHVARQILETNSPPSIVLVVYTQSLVEMYRTAVRELSKNSDKPFNLPIMTIYAFMDSNENYDYILCDEVQDITPRMLYTMRQRSAHLIVAGDSAQSIYKTDPRWNERTVEDNQVVGYIQGYFHKLITNMRLTESIINAVRAFVPAKIIGQTTNFVQNQTQINVYRATTLNAEIDYIAKQSLRCVDNEYTTAILIPSQRKMVDFVNKFLAVKNLAMWSPKNNRWGKTDFGSMNLHLSKLGIKMQYVGNGYGSFRDNADYVVLITYHSSKGLDFDYVFLPFCNSYMWLSQDEEISKTLFMVAMTRARVNLNISYTGMPHPYVRSFENNCRVRDI